MAALDAAVARLASALRDVPAPVCTGGTARGAVTITLRVPAADGEVEEAAAASLTNLRKEVVLDDTADMSALTACMPQAAFGHNSETLVDTRVRDAWQLSAEQFEAAGLEEVVSNAVAQASQVLMGGAPVRMPRPTDP